MLLLYNDLTREVCHIIPTVSNGIREKRYVFGALNDD